VPVRTLISSTAATASLHWMAHMSLTVFLAICILGCDVLIYFLYEWAFGESKRIRKRAANAHLMDTTQVCSQRRPATPARSARVVEMNRDRRREEYSAAFRERLAYQRLAVSMRKLKPEG
jgi:hypothetical protein